MDVSTTMTKLALLLLFTLGTRAVYADDDNPCQDKKNGIYPVPDVFKYIICKDNSTVVRQCLGNSFYVPDARKCVRADEQDPKKFCHGRPQVSETGNWRNPWNCHGYIACSGEQEWMRECQQPGLVYNPDTDQCVQDFKCRQVKSTPISVYGDGDKACQGKEDGNYPVPDVFKYLICTGGASSYENCPANYYYMPQVKKCLLASDQDPHQFCVGRPKVSKTGNWRNPWDCHGYIACNGEQEYMMPCPSGLVYDADNDLCDHVECKQVNPQPDSDPCHDMADGNYPMPDVFKYMVCTGGKHSYVTCPDKTFFVPSANKCLPASSQNVKNFCVGRPKVSETGNWRNPWDCHRYIACNGPYSYNMPCQLPSLVYDPYLDLCEHDFPCKQV